MMSSKIFANMPKPVTLAAKELLIASLALLVAFEFTSHLATCWPLADFYKEVFFRHRSEFESVVAFAAKRSKSGLLGYDSLAGYQFDHGVWRESISDDRRVYSSHDLASALDCTESELRNYCELCRRLGLAFVATPDGEKYCQCAFLDGVGRNFFHSGAKSYNLFRPRVYIVYSAPNETSSPGKRNQQIPSGWSVKTTIGQGDSEYNSLGDVK
jgi:hypothetical protein